MLVGNCDRDLFFRVVHLVSAMALRSKDDKNCASGRVYLSSKGDGFLTVFTVGDNRSIRIQLAGDWSEGESVWSRKTCTHLLNSGLIGETLSLFVMDQAITATAGTSSVTLTAEDETFKAKQLDGAMPSGDGETIENRFEGWAILELSDCIKVLDFPSISSCRMETFKRSTLWKYSCDAFLFDYSYVSKC